MANNKDFKVKNGIQPTAYNEGLGTVTSGSAGYYLAGGSYDSKSLSTQAVSIQQIYFKSDGLTAYSLHSSTDTAYQYTLSTAWDVSTGTYASKSFSFASQDSDPVGMFFKSDGTKVYITGYINKAVYQYSLSTAWDISTASYDSVSFSVSSQDTPRNIFFKSDGTKFYIVGNVNDVVYQYSLSTAWDVSTASYDSVSFSVVSQDSTSTGLYFKPDGTEMYTVGNNNDSVYLYNLSTAWDISTASYSNVSFSVASQDLNPVTVFLGDSGTKMYVGGQSNNNIEQYSTALNTAELDLSTGSVFEVTPTSDIQVTLSNPADSGTVSQATLLLNQEGTGPAGLFSTTLYTGADGQTINNGIDLASEGGLVWTKSRTTAYGHALVDTENGIGTYLRSDQAAALRTDSYAQEGITSFNSDGYTLGNWSNEDRLNRTGIGYVSWTFRKHPKFFDVVTYTGNGIAGRTVGHNLDSEPGMIIVKCTSHSSTDWNVYHRGANGTVNPEQWYGWLNQENSFDDGASSWNDVAPTSTEFTVSNSNDVNGSGREYVAYIFAHDSSASSKIKCGSYEGANHRSLEEVNLGFEPQWLLLKNANSTLNDAQWTITDNVRGADSSNGGVQLKPAQTFEETTSGSEGPVFTENGFYIKGADRDFNNASSTYIYVAIPNVAIPTITYDNSIEFVDGAAPTAPGVGDTDVLTFTTRDGGSTYSGVLAIDGAK